MILSRATNQSLAMTCKEQFRFLNGIGTRRISTQMKNDEQLLNANSITIHPKHSKYRTELKFKVFRHENWYAICEKIFIFQKNTLFVIFGHVSLNLWPAVYFTILQRSCIYFVS